MRNTLIALFVLIPALLAPVYFVSAAPVVLPVPYISEVPDGQWVGSWKNACEEASIAMVDRFYAKTKIVSKTWAKTFMTKLFAVEKELWKSDANSDTEMTVKLINENSSFNGKVVGNPSVDDIKAEIDAGRPVIVPINGFILANKNIPFLRTGSGYHMFVIIGYDDTTGEFIANDTGDTKSGIGIRYAYDRIMSSLYDYDFTRHKTDGPARAIFTYPKIVKTAFSHRIYFLKGETRQYINHPLVFAQNAWDWSWVNVVFEPWLRRSFYDGPTISPR